MEQENDWKNGKYVLTIIAEHFYCLSVMMGVKTLCDLWKFAREREKQMLWKIFGNFTGSRSFKSTGILRQHCQELASHPHFHTYTHTVTFGLNGTVSACVVFRGQVYSGQNVDVDPQRWRRCVCATRTNQNKRATPKGHVRKMSRLLLRLEINCSEINKKLVYIQMRIELQCQFGTICCSKSCYLLHIGHRR